MLLTRQVCFLVVLVVSLCNAQSIYNQCIANEMTGFNVYNFYDEPAYISLSYCEESSGNSCCSVEYSELIGDYADPFSVSFNQIIRQPLGMCRTKLEDVSCIMCNTAQSDWIYLSEDRSSLVMCLSYCEELYDACLGEVTTLDNTVGNQYSSAPYFCLDLFSNITASHTPVKVIIDQHNTACWSNLPECTEDSYYKLYSECINNQRELIWVKKPEVECSGGFENPQNLYNQPCAQVCDAGYYFDGSSCAACDPGSYSLGGDLVEELWTNWDSLAFPFNTYCTWVDEYGVERTWTEGNCPGWGLDLQSISSPVALNNSMSAYLETSVTLMEPGSLIFTAKVDSERNFDGLTVYIDREPSSLGFISRVLAFTEYSIDLDAGYHFIQFVYSKDISISMGLDQAIINRLEVTHVTSADDSCSLCHPGYYQSQSGASACNPCPANSHSSNYGASACIACEPGYSAYEGSAECDIQEPCTNDDYYYLFGPCYFDEEVQAPRRDSTPYWYDPHVCAGELPSVMKIACGYCEPGSYREEDGVTCSFCEPGTYSVGDGASCEVCGAGSEAAKQINFDEFNSFDNGLYTVCEYDCGTDGWLLRNDYIDSGHGHGEYVVSHLVLNQTFIAPGEISFEYSLDCESDCQFSFESDAGITWRASGGYSWNQNQVRTFLIPSAGSYSFLWTFTRTDTDGSARDDRAVLSFITLTHTEDGGATECTPCEPGYYNPSSSASQCIPASPGYYSPGNSEYQYPCEGNTYSDEEASIECKLCGENINANSDHTGCDITCQLIDNNNIYDLSPLARYDGEMYGPVWDSKNNTYYLNMCTMVHNGHTCFNDDGTPLDTFACQVTGRGLGLDLGNVFGMLPLRNLYGENTQGVTVHLSEGALCHNLTVYFPRETYIDVVCDPEAGVGTPIAINDVETHKCYYEFLWHSLYGCALCTENDYHYVASECDSYGNQTITYEWNSNPKTCHGGISLPESESRRCETSVYCGPGYYYDINTNDCELAPVGYYSIGNGFKITNWTTDLTSEFTNNGWTSHDYYIQSGEGDTTLLFVQNFILDGTITFTYSVNNYGDSTAGFSVYLDDIEMGYEIHTTSNQYRSMTINVPSGYHYIKFLFEGGTLTTSQSQARAVRIQDFTVLGTSWASANAIPCPAGTFSSEEGSTRCEDCPWNTSSNEASDHCDNCENDKYAFPGSSICTPKGSCGLADYRISYSECENGEQANEYVLLEPIICYEETPPETLDDSVECFPCEEGKYRTEDSDECKSCDIGEYWSGDQCKSAKSGHAAILTTSYFVYPLAGDSLPSEFSTGCSGDCFCRNTDQCTDGWRMHSSYIDSGMSTNREVDMYLDLTLDLVNQGSITFTYEVTGPSSNGLEFYINDKQYSAPYHPSSSLKSEKTVSFNVDSGNTIFRWNYHQEPETSGSISLSSIIIEGVGSAVGESKCPAGTYSEGNGNSVCELCPAGTSNSEEGSTGCAICDENSYSPIDGSTECILCGDGTFANEDRTDCISDCIFTLQDTTYDLSGLQTTHGPFPLDDESGIWMNICEKRTSRSFCLDPYGESISTYMCEVDLRGNGIDIGNHLSVDLTKVDDDKDAVRLSYSVEGDDENNCSSTVTIVCSPDAPYTNPYLLDNPTDCNIHLRWDSTHGCPVCNEEIDYEIQDSECEDGVRTINTVRISNCDGPAILTSTTESCPTRYSVSIAVIIVVAVVILLLCVVIVAVVIYNRRLSNQYTALVRDSEGQYEMKDMDEDTTVAEDV